jgi:4'-phosphopantetheinyl transferase
MIALDYRVIEPGEGHETGRALLRQMYRAHRNMEMPEVVEELSGKPRFVEDPIHFSISHTKYHVFCALSDLPIGIDAEEQSRTIDLRLAEKILSPTEKIRYDLCSDKREALLRFWVLKEAAVKQTGEGLRGYPNHTDFSPDDPAIRIIDGCFVAVIE